MVCGSRTSWVERFEASGQALYLKTYVYPAPWGPLRGAFRNTFLAASRARREWRALELLARAGVQPGLGVDLSERRCLGFLLEARLLTRDFGGTDLAELLRARGLEAGQWRALWAGLARFVRALHDSGLRDPDLKARNILLRETSQGPEFAKIDASSSWIVAPSRWDRARVRDLEVLARDLLILGAKPREIAPRPRRPVVPRPTPSTHQNKPNELVTIRPARPCQCRCPFVPVPFVPVPLPVLSARTRLPGCRRFSRQPLRRVSSNNVTGPSLTSSTCMFAAKRPVATRRTPRSRSSLTKSS